MNLDPSQLQWYSSILLLLLIRRRRRQRRAANKRLKRSSSNLRRDRSNQQLRPLDNTVAAAASFEPVNIPSPSNVSSVSPSPTLSTSASRIPSNSPSPTQSASPCSTSRGTSSGKSEDGVTEASKQPKAMDEDEHYCMSLAERMRQLSPRKKAKLRLDLEALFFNAQFGN